MSDFECGEYLFSSNFDSGNLRKVELVRSCSETEVSDYVIHAEFDLWTSPDCYGTPYENPNRTWFFFSVKGGRPFRNIKLNVRNLNRQAKLFSQGMQPVMRIGENGKWERIKDKPAYSTEGEGFYISFIHRTNDSINIPHFYAFTYPFTYNECLNMLDKFDRKYGKSLQDIEYITNRIMVLGKEEKEQAVKKVDPSTKTKTIIKEPIIIESNMEDINLVPSPHKRDHSSGSQSSSSSEAVYDKMSKRELQNEIYYHRELLIHSLQKRRVELLTISSFSGIQHEREERLSNLFPDREKSRCRIFKDKKIIFMSSRVHPGETASSFVLNGFLNLILDKKSSIGQTLRQLYVFKIVPFLNPDGVYNGLYRTDTLGQNLNRMYICPQIDRHPSIYGVKKLIKYYHLGYDRFDDENKRIALIEQSKTISPVPVRSSVPVHSKRKPEMKDEVCSTESLFELVDKMRSDTSKSENEMDSPSQSYSSKETTSSESEEIGGPTVVQNLATSNSSEGTIFTEKLIPEIKAIAQEPTPKRISPTVSGINKKPSEPVYRKNSTFKTVFGSSHVGNINRSTENKLKDLQNTTTVQRSKYKKVIVRKDVKPCNLVLKALNKKNLLCCQNIDISSEHEGLEKSDKSNLFLYMDFHGHASKKGIFMYGNHFQSTHEAVECMLLPRLMGMNCQHFHYESCNFSERNMYRREKRDGLSKEGSGRVAVFKMTGLIKCYTLESNYNTGKYVNTLPSRMKELNQKPPTVVPPKYTPAIYEEVGRALGPSILDITNSNPISRIYNSEYRAVQALRIAIRNEVERHGSQRSVLNSGKILSTSQKRVKRGSLAVASTSNDVPKENKAIYHGKNSPWDLAVPSSSTQTPPVSVLQSLNQPTKMPQRAARCIRRNPLKAHSTNLYGKNDAAGSKKKPKSGVLLEASCSTSKKDHNFPIPLKKVRVSPTHNSLPKDVLPPVKKSSIDSSSSAESSYKEKPADNPIAFEPNNLTDMSPMPPTSSEYNSPIIVPTDKPTSSNHLASSVSMTQFHSSVDLTVLKKCTSESGLDIYAAKADLAVLAVPGTSMSSFENPREADDAVPSCSSRVIVHSSSKKPILATFRKTKKADGFLVKSASGNLTSSMNPKMKNAFGGSDNSKLGKKKRIIRHDSLIVKRKKNKAKITRH